MVDITLTGDDVANVRFGHSAVWEVVASLHALSDPATHHLHRSLRRSLTGSSHETIAELAQLTHVRGWIPDTLAPPPVAASESPVAQFARVCETSGELVESDLDVLRRAAPDSRWSRLEADEFVDRLSRLLTRYWTRELMPRWDSIQAVAQSDVAERERGIARDGVGAAMGHIHPGVSYTKSTLHIELGLRACQVTGTGDGVWLLPTVFRWPRIALSTDVPGPVVISYPALGAAKAWSEHHPRESAVSALIGRSRAAVLADLDVARTTSALAGRLNLSPATVSVHLTTLAASGLVRRRREGRQVLYSRTTFGLSLLSGEYEGELA